MMSSFTDSTCINIQEAIQFALDLPNSEGEFLNTVPDKFLPNMFIISIIHLLADKFVEDTRAKTLDEITGVQRLSCKHCTQCCRHTIGLIFPLELHYIYFKLKFKNKLDVWCKATDRARILTGAVKNNSNFLCPFFDFDKEDCKIKDFKSVFCKVYGYEKFYNDYTGQLGLYACTTMLDELNDADLNNLDIFYDKYKIAFMDDPALSLITGMMLHAVGSLPLTNKGLLDRDHYANIVDKIKKMLSTKKFRKRPDLNGIEILDSSGN